jgi:flagellar motor switch protein FliN/FliY
MPGAAQHGVTRQVTGLDKLDVEMTVVLGKARMPLHQLLVLGRGAVVALDGPDGQDAERVQILANGLLVAYGAVVVKGDRIAVEILDLVRPETVLRTPGTRIGGSVPVSADRMAEAA